MLKLEGTIEDIIFRNESNGYTVAKLKTSDGLITIVGNVALLNLEEMVEVEGDWVYHNNFGEQLNFSQIRSLAPSSLKGIENYLSSGLLPYVGPKTAKLIVERFGLSSLEVIQYNPEKLKEIPGIGDKKLDRIAKAYEEHRELRDIMVFLQQYDISVNNGIKIYKTYGKDTIRIVRENPYKLSEDVYGIGFKTADTIARKMGIDLNSSYRAEAGLRYLMLESAGDGHSYLLKDELIKKALDLLAIEEEIIEDGLKNLVLRKNFYLKREGEDFLVYYAPYYIAENNVARKIVDLSRVDFEDIELDIDEKIKEIERDNQIEFGHKQKLAIRDSISNGLMIISGGPGTGKTTTINAIIEIYEGLDKKVLLAAPTGRAAKRMTEASGRESKTIHRLLEFSYMEEDMAFNKNEDSPLEADLIIIDEASMIDILLMNSLLKAVSPGTRLILVGDIDQLPSVGAGNVLKDIIASESIGVNILDEIFRQAEESMIVVNAHRINKGEKPILNQKDKDFYFENKLDGDAIVSTIIDLNKDRLPNFYQMDPIRDIQVISPMRRGEVGINALNKYLQEALNPKSKEKPEKQVGDEIFRLGDKVMQIKNNYNTEWTISKEGAAVEKGLGVFNGDFGFITELDLEGMFLRVIFDDEKEVEYNFNQLDELKLAYAITVHKSQGSEFPIIVMPIYWGPPMLLTRNLIYTAITRAKRLVVLVGQEKYLYGMIRNNRIAKRNSSLDKKIREAIEVFY